MILCWGLQRYVCHDDVIKWKHFPRYWPFMRGIHRSPLNSPHNGQWRGALMFSLICTRINGWVNTGQAGDLRRHFAHYDVIVMQIKKAKGHSRWERASNAKVWRFFVLYPSKPLKKKQSRCRWFELKVIKTFLCHCDILVEFGIYM